MYFVLFCASFFLQRYETDNKTGCRVHETVVVGYVGAFILCVDVWERAGLQRSWVLCEGSVPASLASGAGLGEELNCTSYSVYVNTLCPLFPKEATANTPFS